MSKFLFSLTVSCLLTVAISAQNRTRVFDNFDTASGVQVVTPTVPSIIETKNKKSVKKTVAAKTKIVVTNNLKPSEGVASLSMAKGSGMGAFTTGDATIDSYITDSSARYKIDPLLIYAQMHQESAFKLKATSYKGARGLMQLMPATAIRFGVTDIYNPKQNIEAGIKYMRWLLDKFGGDVSLALAGYNAGEGAVMKYGRQIPPYNETREYVRRISARYSSIRNPNQVKVVKKVTVQQVAKLEKKVAAPLTTYEPNALTVRLPDGRMRLVNQ